LITRGLRDGQPELFRLPEMNFVRRPIAALGNSDGDLEMLQWARAVIAPSKTGVNRDCGAKPS
jgi:hypothetical protein